MKFVSEKRFNDEHLAFAHLKESPISPQELPCDIDYGIVDANGVVYGGLIRENGTVDDGYTNGTASTPTVGSIDGPR
jgi:hypothetical protein